MRPRLAIISRQANEAPKLPLCNLDWGRDYWPFFQPLITDTASGRPLHLGEE